jgi:hypothetical protein
VVELALLVAITMSGQLATTVTAVGGRVSWRPIPLVGLEAEVTISPRDFPESQPFSRGQVEGLFGLTAGPTFGRYRPFVKFRPGFLTIREAPEPRACILIYPPPLACVLALGRTLAAVDTGGGLEIGASRGMFLRLEAGDRMIRYPGPVFELARRRIRERSFFDHDVRFALAAGVRF